MRLNASDLPAALRSVAGRPGLESFRGLNQPFPVACAPASLLKKAEFDKLPVYTNFCTAILDMDREADRKEYKRIMEYHTSHFGMQICHLERVLVVKVKKVKGKQVKRKVRRIYIEYFAPYYVTPVTMG
jgi:hypothetical protein